ncbi:MAG: nicotinate phosphoribosyltransferase, partial [Okeania sp. SIO2H7]|nr:nicotinate phosphoribosyltransferase [Okeania sp. SIO2H7]
ISAIEGTERDAFSAFYRYFPGAALLIDTYDTVEAARKLADMAKGGEIDVKGIRLDSGDLVKLSKETRSLLPEATIFVSGDIDEWEIVRLKEAGAEIDGYGIGTKLVTGSPVNGVYKLVEIDGIPVMKEASGKITYPGRKQILRYFEDGKMRGDCLKLLEEEIEVNGESSNLLELVMRDGKVLEKAESLEAIARRTATSVASLPPETRCLENPNLPPMEISRQLQELTEKTRKS